MSHTTRVSAVSQSPVAALTSMDWRREVAFGPPRIARLKPSRSVRFTNRYTEPALDVRFSQPSQPARPRTRLVVHPVIGGPPAREQIRQRARPSGPGPAA